MEVNEALVEKLAHLSKLSFEAGEKEKIKDGLQKMVSFIEKLREVDTKNVQPLLHITPSVSVLRKDVVDKGIDRVEALKNAANHTEQFFLVPKVIKK